MSEDQPGEHKNFAEERRPGISAIVDELRAKHPTWSEDRIECAAKEEWHRRQP